MLKQLRYTRTHLACCVQLWEMKMTFSRWWVHLLLQRSADLVMTDNTSPCGCHRCARCVHAALFQLAEAEKSLNARDRVTALSFDCGVKQEKQICFFLHVLAPQWRSDISDLQCCDPSIISVSWEVSQGSDIKGSCCVFCELDLSGARVDDKCDSSCHCGMPGLMMVLLIEWRVSCGLWTIKLLRHCWSELLKRKANRWRGLSS